MMEDKKPKGADIVTEKILDEMRQMAAKLPPAPKEIEKEPVQQFGNSFYFLFYDPTIASMDFNPFPSEAAEQYGEKWGKFLQEEKDLVGQIRELLTLVRLLVKLASRRGSLLKKEETKAAGIQIDRELNLMGINNEIWRKLNPLLYEAAERMKKAGMDPKIFFSSSNS